MLWLIIVGAILIAVVWPLILLLGGPLWRDLRLLDAIEREGGEVVLDATEGGERTLPLPADRRALADDPLEEVVRIHFDGIPDAFRRPNSELYRWLRRELAGREVRGIVFRRHPWCDIWHAEAPRVREWAGVPVLEIDPTGEAGEETSIAGKVASFLESLR